MRPIHPSKVDRPLQIRRNTFRARLKRNVLTAIALLAIVIGIGALPLVFIYFMSETGEQSGSTASAQGGSAMAQAKQARAKRNAVTAFVNVHVVPMDGERVIAGQTVIVKDGRIAEIGPAASVIVPAGAARVEGRGAYLMPGLADMHVHLQSGRQDNLALLQLFAANGVTTVLNLRGTPEHLALRESVARGEVFGPTVYTVGPYVNEPFVTTPEDVEREVVEQKRAGYDFIKMHGDLSREAYRRLFVAARREGIRVVGHSPRNLGIEAMIEERQHAVAHSEEYLYDTSGSSKNFAQLEPRIPSIAQATARAGTWLIPNLTAYKNIALQVMDIEAVYNRPEMRYLPPGIASRWSPANNPYVRRFDKSIYPGFVARYRVLEKLVKGFHDAGVRLLAGTDALNPSVVPGFSIYEELNYLVAAGLSPYESLRTATANAAEFLGADDFGTIAVGKRADLMLVEGDPLKDVTNASKRVGVMLGGLWLAEADARKMLDDLSASYATRR